MPFTPLHLGPALLVALIMYPLLDIPTFLLASVIIDFEPLIILIIGLPQPLHGQYHSLTLGIVPALFVGIIMYFVKSFTNPLMVRFKLPQTSRIRVYLLSAFTGVWLHVITDALMYQDINLAYPLSGNPLLGILETSLVIRISLLAFPMSFIIYFIRVTITSLREKRNLSDKYIIQQEKNELVESQETNEVNIGLDLENSTIGKMSTSDMLTVTHCEETVPKDELKTQWQILKQTKNIPPDVFLGSDKPPNQWGIIGKTEKQIVAVDLNEPHIVFVCGKQGSGKGYTVGVISEMLLSKSIPCISQVEKPATIIVFHKPREDIRSEFWSIVEPNKNQAESTILKEEYGIEPGRVITEKSFRIFVDPFVYLNEREKFEEDYGTNVFPIGIKPTRLTAEDWPHVLSLGKKSGSMYVKKIFQIIKKTQYESDFGLKTIRREVESSDLNPNQKGFAMMRLETLEDYLEGGDFINDLKMGGVNVFDLRKIMMEPDDVFSVMMLVVSALINNERTEHEQFVFVINEAHDYLRKGLSKDFTDYINYLIRKKRHAGTWLMLDTHFPEDVDPKVIKGSDIKIFHKSDVISSTLLRQIVEGTSTPPHQLSTGEAIIRADKSNQGPDSLMIVKIRPRLTHHGGATKTAT